MAEVPKNNNKKKPTPKKKFSFDDFKKKNNIVDFEEKPLEWYSFGEAFKRETGLEGMPKGYVTLSRGYSNTGKSTSLSLGCVAVQKAGDLPIIIDTENNVSKERLEMMGFDFSSPYIFIDNDFLLEEFGKNFDKNMNAASIEDLAECVHHYLNLQEQGELPMNIVFFIDSLGTLDCRKTIRALENDTTNNNMWNAGAFEQVFKSILNTRIPSSRKVGKEYTNSIFAVQKIWLDSMQPGQPVVKHKGGEAFWYGARLIYHHGGKLTHGVRTISAVSKKREVVYGHETKITVAKNQVGGVSLEGKLISTPHGFIGTDKEDKDSYKKSHLQYFRDILENENITADEISMKYGSDDEQNTLDIDTFNSQFDQI
jgi:hypothetical protein